MKKIKSTILIQYLALGYFALYILFIISGSFGGSFPDLNAEGIGVYSLFLLFIVGLVFSWIDRLTTGIILFIWNIGMWFIESVLVKEGGGFGIIAGVPLIVLGAFFILKGIEEKGGVKLNQKESWKIETVQKSVSKV